MRSCQFRELLLLRSGEWRQVGILQQLLQHLLVLLWVEGHASARECGQICRHSWGCLWMAHLALVLLNR